MPWGPAGLINFSEVWDACISAASVNSVLLEEVFLLMFLFPSPFIGFVFSLLSVLPFFLPSLTGYHTSVSAKKQCLFCKVMGWSNTLEILLVEAASATSNTDTTVWHWDFCTAVCNCAHILVQIVPRWADTPAFNQTASGCKQEYFQEAAKCFPLVLEVLILCRLNNSLQDLQWDWRESARDWGPKKWKYPVWFYLDCWVLHCGQSQVQDILAGGWIFTCSIVWAIALQTTENISAAETGGPLLANCSWGICSASEV